MHTQVLNKAEIEKKQHINYLSHRINRTLHNKH